ncbi:MAG TPA: prolyl oligopeptidase family serine peptidase, partial [Phycisphaerae bacterium]|nr:prolyl oligopeptidase family serine peptidase [Phycisphaerae bacterium]
MPSLASRVRMLCLVVLLTAAVPPAAAQQAGELRAVHRAGQTLLTWTEVPAARASDEPTVADVKRLAQDLARQRIRYRLYRSDKPIRTLDGLECVAEVSPLSGWNIEYYGDPKPQQKALRYVIEEGKPPLGPNVAVWAHNPATAGRAWYAVTACRGDQEDKSLDAANVLRQPVDETVGLGLPVLQRVEKPKSFNYVDNPTLHYYVRWEPASHCGQPGRPYDYLVAIPPRLAKPAAVGIHLHCWGGNLNSGYGWWYNAEKGAILLASNQVPYDWWTGYHEKYFQRRRSKETWSDGVVRPYTQRRMMAFLDFVASRWEVDLSRTFAAGSSMGGSGSPMLAIRNGGRIAWAVSWVGVHVPAHSPHFKGSYAQVYGEPEWGVKFEDGVSAWDHYDDAKYLRSHPRDEVGLITFSNGKNDSGIGWPQAMEFLRALQETHRPFVFVWGQSGHGQRATMPVTLGERVMELDLRTDRSLPAFNGCSLDDDPGDGRPDRGDAKGQINLFLAWKTDDAVDADGRWEMTVYLIDKSPRGECTVDVTPRRCQRFKGEPGQAFVWTNTVDGGQVQTGTALADQWGLVTLKGVKLSRSPCRLAIRRK